MGKDVRRLHMQPNRPVILCVGTDLSCLHGYLLPATNHYQFHERQLRRPVPRHDFDLERWRRLQPYRRVPDQSCKLPDRTKCFQPEKYCSMRTTQMHHLSTPCVILLQLPTQVYMAVLFAVFDLVLNFQHCWYCYWLIPRRKRRQQAQRAAAPPGSGQTLHMPMPTCISVVLCNMLRTQQVSTSVHCAFSLSALAANLSSSLHSVVLLGV